MRKDHKEPACNLKIQAGKIISERHCPAANCIPPWCPTSFMCPPWSFPLLWVYTCLIGETVETVSDFIFLGSKITADGDCSHEIKRRFPLGRKVMTNLDSIFKSRDITLPTKVRLVKAMVFPVVMYGCQSWHPLSSPSPPTLNPSQHQSLFQ